MAIIDRENVFKSSRPQLIRLAFFGVVLGSCVLSTAQDLPTVSSLIEEIIRFEKQYLGTRLELDDSILKNHVLRSSKDGSVVSSEFDNPSRDPRGSGKRGGCWANKKFRVLFTGGHDHSQIAGILGNQRAVVGSSFFGFSDLDYCPLSEIFSNSSSNPSVKKGPNGSFMLESDIDNRGVYTVEFDEVEPSHFRIRSWTILKRKGDPIVNGPVRFFVGVHNKNLGDSPYDSAVFVKSEITINGYDELGRPQAMSSNLFLQSATTGHWEVLDPYPWTQRITKCLNTDMSADVVSFESFEIPDKIKIDMYESGQDEHKLVGQSYQLNHGKLVQVASGASISAIENPPAFRRPESRWWYYVVLGLPCAIIALVLIWFRSKRMND